MPKTMLIGRSRRCTHTLTLRAWTLTNAHLNPAWLYVPLRATRWLCRNHTIGYYTMATAAVQHAPGHSFANGVGSAVTTNTPKKHDVATELYYYKAAEDGSPQAPTYVG